MYINNSLNYIETTNIYTYICIKCKQQIITKTVKFVYVCVSIKTYYDTRVEYNLITGK